jgi:hypothetical protein
MDRTSDFVRPDDVLDPDRSAARPDDVDCNGSGGLFRRSVVTLVCIAGVVAIAALQPHARKFQVTAPAVHNQIMYH